MVEQKQIQKKILFPLCLRKTLRKSYPLSCCLSRLTLQKVFVADHQHNRLRLNYPNQSPINIIFKLFSRPCQVFIYVERRTIKLPALV